MLMGSCGLLRTTTTCESSDTGGGGDGRAGRPRAWPPREGNLAVVRAGERWGVDLSGSYGSNNARGLGSVFGGVRADPSVDVFGGAVYRAQGNYKDGTGTEVGNTGNDLKGDHQYRKSKCIVIEEGPAPDLKKLLHLIAEAQWVIGLDEA